MIRRLLGLDRLNLLSAEARRLIVVFTVVETVILTLWLALIPGNAVVAAVVLLVGLLVEHLIAGVSGKV